MYRHASQTTEKLVALHQKKKKEFSLLSHFVVFIDWDWMRL